VSHGAPESQPSLANETDSSVAIERNYTIWDNGAYNPRQSGGKKVKHRSAAILVLLFVLSVISRPLFAHHGNASYDYAKTVTIKGKVTAWIFANPHSLMKLDVTDDKGNVQHWVLEGNPAATVTAGWHKSIVKPGDIIVVDIMPPKNGAQIGRIRRILRPDGTVLADLHLPSTLNDVPPPKELEKDAKDSK
jgi:hypothetical protein